MATKRVRWHRLARLGLTLGWGGLATLGCFSRDDVNGDECAIGADCPSERPSCLVTPGEGNRCVAVPGVGSDISGGAGGSISAGGAGVGGQQVAGDAGSTASGSGGAGGAANASGDPPGVGGSPIGTAGGSSGDGGLAGSLGNADHGGHAGSFGGAGNGGSTGGIGSGGFGGCRPVGCEEGSRPGNPNVCELAATQPWSGPTCEDLGLGLTASGVITSRGEGDLLVLGHDSPQPSSFVCQSTGFDAGHLPRVHCQRGAKIGVSVACGEMPTGSGGELSFGGYALTEYAVYVEHDISSYPVPGAGIAQTIYVGPSSLVLASDDDNNFAFTGSYTTALEDNAFSLEPVCESTLARYRAFPLNATFTATATSLVIFDADRRIRMSYELLP